MNNQWLALSETAVGNEFETLYAVLEAGSLRLPEGLAKLAMGAARRRKVGESDWGACVHVSLLSAVTPRSSQFKKCQGPNTRLSPEISNMSANNVSTSRTTGCRIGKNVTVSWFP